MCDQFPQVDLADSDGWTPLKIASQNGHSKVVKLLFQHGAQVLPHTFLCKVFLILCLHWNEKSYNVIFLDNKKILGTNIYVTGVYIRYRAGIGKEKVKKNDENFKKHTWPSNKSILL